MNLQLTILAESQGGVFTRAQAFSYGFSLDEVRRAVSSGTWHRVRRGTYVTAQRWEELDLAGRHVLGLRAVMLSTAPPVVASHSTAAAVLSLEQWEPSYDWIHVTRPEHSARREAGVWHHEATLASHHVVSMSGVLTTSPVRTAVDIARTVDFEHAVVIVDSALRLTGAGVETLRAAHLETVDWPGARGAGRAVAFADARSGSPGESRARVHLAGVALIEVLSQVSIYDESDRLVGVGDWLVDGKIITEFDGRMKYGLDGLDPAALSERLWREKEREDALRRLGYEIVRIVWADLYHPERIRSRVRAAMARAAVSGPIRGRFAVDPLRTIQAV